MKDHKKGNSDPGNRDNQIKDKNPGIQQINDDDFHSERDLERNNRINDILNEDHNPNSPRNDNREDKNDEFDEDSDKNEDDYLKKDKK